MFDIISEFEQKSDFSVGNNLFDQLYDITEETILFLLIQIYAGFGQPNWTNFTLVR